MERSGIIKAHVETEIVRFVTLGYAEGGKVVCHPSGHEWIKGANAESPEEFMRMHEGDYQKMTG